MPNMQDPIADIKRLDNADLKSLLEGTVSAKGKELVALIMEVADDVIDENLGHYAVAPFLRMMQKKYAEYLDDTDLIKEMTA